MTNVTLQRSSSFSGQAASIYGPISGKLYLINQIGQITVDMTDEFEFIADGWVPVGAGGGVIQTGAITTGHLATWASGGVIQDGGAVPIGNVTQTGAITAGHLTTWSSTGVIQDGGAPPPPFAQIFPGVNVKDYGAVGDGVHDDTNAIRAAFSASSAVFFPYGVYLVSSTIALPQSAILLGQGSSGIGIFGPFVRSSIYAPAITGFVFAFDVPIGKVWKAPQLCDMTIVTQDSGIRVNTVAGGIPEGGGTQGVAEGFCLERTAIYHTGSRTLPGGPSVDGFGTGTGVLLCLTSHFRVGAGAEIEGFGINLDIHFNANPSHIVDSRFWQYGTAGIKIDTIFPYGALITIDSADFQIAFTGATGCLVSNNFFLVMRDCYVEQHNTQGTGLQAAIVITDGAWSLTIEDCIIGMPTSCAPNWLKVTATSNINLVHITGNTIAGDSSDPPGPATFNGGSGLPPFVGGGIVPVTCVHLGNSFRGIQTDGSAGIPFNSVQRILLPPGVLSIITPELDRSIINQYYNTATTFISTPVMAGAWPATTGNAGAAEVPLPSPGSSQNIIVFIDPTTTVKSAAAATVKVQLRASAPITNLVWELYDNLYDGSTFTPAGGTASGVIATVAVAQAWYTLTTNATFSTRMFIIFRNNAGSGGTAYIKQIVTSA